MSLPLCLQEDYESALRTGTALQERHYLHHIEHAEPFTASPSKLYMFVEEEAPVSSALNARKPFLKPARSATQVRPARRTHLADQWTMSWWGLGMPSRMKLARLGDNKFSFNISSCTRSLSPVHWLVVNISVTDVDFVPPSIQDGERESQIEARHSSSSPQVAGELRRRILELYDEALSKDGKSVLYSQLASSPAYAAYREATEELQRVSWQPVADIGND